MNRPASIAARAGVVQTFPNTTRRHSQPHKRLVNMTKEELDDARKVLHAFLLVDVVIAAIVLSIALSIDNTLQDIRAARFYVDQLPIDRIELLEKISKISFFTSLAVGFAIVNWLNTCYSYARSTIGAKGLKNDSYTIWGWIIPFVNLYKPYQIITEIYQVGSPDYSTPQGWRTTNKSEYILIWWMFWILSGAASWPILRTTLTSLNEDLSPNDIIAAITVVVSFSVLSLTRSALWFLISNKLTTRLLSRPGLSDSTNLSIRHADAGKQQEESYTKGHPFESQTNSSTLNIDPSPPITSTDSHPPNIDPSSIGKNDAIYEAVANEIDKGTIDKGLWTRLYAELDGNEHKVKAAYIRHRVNKLIAAEQLRLQEADAHRIKRTRLYLISKTKGAADGFIESVRTNPSKLKKIQIAAQYHKDNPRLTIEEKADLLRLSGGNFFWLGAKGKCSASFLGYEREFASGKDFSDWFNAEVVPFLLAATSADIIGNHTLPS
jgi:hypothetical protein